MTLVSDKPTKEYLVRLGPPASGEVIHRSTCRHATALNAHRWVWADDPANRAELPSIGWLRPCGRCKPYEKSPFTAALIS